MPKRLVLTAHAQMRLRERKLKVDWIEATARNPDWTEPDPEYADAERRFRIIDEFGGRTLRAVCTETDTMIRVITVMFDRKARRKS